MPSVKVLTLQGL